MNNEEFKKEYREDKITFAKLSVALLASLAITVDSFNGLVEREKVCREYRQISSNILEEYSQTDQEFISYFETEQARLFDSLKNEEISSSTFHIEYDNLHDEKVKETKLLQSDNQQLIEAYTDAKAKSKSFTWKDVFSTIGLVTGTLATTVFGSLSLVGIKILNDDRIRAKNIKKEQAKANKTTPVSYNNDESQEIETGEDTYSVSVNSYNPNTSNFEEKRALEEEISNEGQNNNEAQL